MKMTIIRPKFLFNDDVHGYIRSKLGTNDFKLLSVTKDFISVLIKENWKTIPGYSQYAASNTGRIKHIDLDEMININYGCGDGRGRVRIVSDETEKSELKLVHRLVAAAFLKPVPNKPLVLHKDGNHLNNNLSNLYYGDYRDNWQDNHRNKVTNTRLNDEQIKQIVELYDSGYSKKQIAEIMKITYPTVHRNLAVND